MIARSFDTDWAEFLANHETVRPHIGMPELGTLELAGLIEDARNVFLEWDNGGFFYHWTAPKVWEVHTMVLPDGRGREALEAAKASLEWMREHGAEKVWTRVRAEDRHTRLFTRAAGLRPLGDRIDGHELYEVRF